MPSAGAPARPDETVIGSENLVAFARIFAMILLVEHWTRALALHSTIDLATAMRLGAATALGVLAWVPSASRLAFAGLAVVQLIVLRDDFPQAGNHAYLELILCVFLALLDPRIADERRLLRQSVCWLTVTILFWSGMQKAVHGCYFQGEQLAYTTWIESFRPVLSLLMPADELARIVAYERDVGDGPYRVAAIFFVLVSNAVYAVEVLLAALLVFRRTRAVAAIVALVFVACVEVAAREVFFGLLFANAVLLFWPGTPHRRLIGIFAVVLFCLLSVRVGIVPEITFY